MAVDAVRSQLTLRTAFTACFAVVATAGAVRFVLETRVALTLTVAAMMVAIALDHVVRHMEMRGLGRGRAIALTILAVTLLIIGLTLVVVPAAVRQLQELIAAIPRILDDLRHSSWFASWNGRFGVEERVKNRFSGAFGLTQSAVDPILGAVTSVLGAVAGFVTVLALTVFMLVFGGGLVRRLLAVAPAVDRPRWEDVLAKSYTAVSGYLGGILFICSINATLTIAVLGLIGAPYFLPLGLLSGFSSLVPYAGPIFTGAFITLVTLATGGAVKALIALGYFLLYGQLEGNVLGPFVVRRTVHLNPLVALLAVLFLAELLGVAGAVVAVPAVAVAQIFVRELLAARRDRLSADASVLPPLFGPASSPTAPPPVLVERPSSR
ncbi:MAG: AI-2E family transporter [Myxococcaceae bacterium]|nr:MAG: AI-2E family transporter [Myxococcaceae bacterium]